MKNLQKGFIVPLIIIVIAGIVIGGTVYSSKSKTKILETDTVLESSDNSVGSTTQNNTIAPSNSKSYTNDKIGFSFSYPSGWYVDDNLKTDTCCLNISNYKSPYSEPLPKDFVKIQIQRQSKSASESLKDIASRPNDDMGGILPKIELVTLAGLNAVKSDIIGDGVFYLPKSPTEYVTIIIFSNPLGKEVAEKVSTQIFSTFKFIK